MFQSISLLVCYVVNIGMLQQETYHNTDLKIQISMIHASHITQGNPVVSNIK